MKEITEIEKEQLIEKVELLESDLLAVMYSIDNDSEPPWDLNDRDNWEALLNAVEEIKQTIGLETSPDFIMS